MKVFRIAKVIVLFAISFLILKCGGRPNNRNPAVDTDTTTEYQDHLTPDPADYEEIAVTHLKTLKKDLDQKIERLNTVIEESDRKAVDRLASFRDGLIEDRSELQNAIENYPSSANHNPDSILIELENLQNRISSKLDSLNNIPELQ